jgi:hypothetical protein
MTMIDKKKAKERRFTEWSVTGEVKKIQATIGDEYYSYLKEEAERKEISLSEEIRHRIYRSVDEERESPSKKK